MRTILLLCCFFAGSLLYAQNSIQGRVTDAESNTALEQVSVYFPQLEKGTVTDEQGVFSLQGLPGGNYKIVVSYIGYKTYSATINLAEQLEMLQVSLSPTAIEMEEVIVSTPFHKLQRENVMKVEQAGLAELRADGAPTLGEGLPTIPGVNNLSTGIGISKPVIRGLSSNRVLVYTQGIRLENQQYGDEHGLGVNDAGISSVEVIKGPASLLYGSDALGGVLYLNPEKYAPEGTIEGDFNSVFYGNTNGLATNAGVSQSEEKFSYLLRAAVSTHEDYETGDGETVGNTRFRDYDLKTGIAYRTTGFRSDIRYNLNRSEVGIPEGDEDFPGNRTPAEPKQEIVQHLLSATNDIYFSNSSLKVILGYTHNNRKEFEEHHHEEAGLIEVPGAGEHEEEPALHMELGTFSYNAQYQLPGANRIETIVGVQGMLQQNRNYGEEILIPDASTKDVGVLATSHLHFKSSDLQLGLRYDYRSIDTERMGSPGSEEFFAPLERDFTSFNAAVGYRADLSPHIIARINLASGFRAPNLAELTSNGSHEGVNRFEIGNPNLENEKNLQTDLALEFSNEHLEWYINGFYNKVSDFIYLQPTGEVREEDPVYEYRQEDSDLYGGEIGLHIHPHPLDWLHLESSFETVTGQRDSGEYLPLIPANSFRNTLRVEFGRNSRKIHDVSAFVTVVSVMEQDKVSDFETTTPAYTLLHAGFGFETDFGKIPAEVRLSGNNLLDKSYISHLSRLKPEGVANIGRNISLGLHLYF